MISIVTSAGTMGRWWMGFPADVARELTDPWLTSRGQCFGAPEGLNWSWRGAEYPSATFPMRPSILKGWDEVVRIISNEVRGKFVLSGYSQGAVISCMVWREEILNPAGRLHNRLNDCLGVFVYGNPMRAPGIAYGNTLLENRPPPKKDDGYTTGGIAGPAVLKPEECLFPVGHGLAGKPAVYDFANDGDLYTACPIGDKPWETQTEVGEYEHLIYESVMDFNGTDLFAWAKTIFKIASQTLTLQWWVFWPLFQAIWNGLKFVSVQTLPHGQYSPWPAIGYLERLGKEHA